MAVAAPVADPARALLERAVELRASDIHLDPAAGGLGIRLRVDGRFVAHGEVEAEEGRRLIGRLKVMAGLMVYRCDVPQEGRVELPGGREARLAIIPTPYGEKATVRLFDPERTLVALGDLAFDAETEAWLRGKLGLDHGLVLVVGPSGSGKTTTLYAALGEIVARRGEFCHVTTIEDPIERRLEGCTQVQVDPLRNLDFAAGLKFLLRQDPEVVMVGEVRDAETARVAVRAAMTGHLVLSTLHCGRAAEARPRLLEMGVEEYAADLALSGVIAQRLVRRVCHACGGSGCGECLESGFRGRVVIAEVLDAGRKRCQRALAAGAAGLVEKRVTTREEVARVLGAAP
jgi:type II secretory ATPase GspE/PulE/Tfp pilus assembly ATPase PilB-like protein